MLLLSEAAMACLGFAWIAVDSLGGFVPWLVVYGFFSGAAVTLPAIVLPHLCDNMAVYGTRLGMLYGVAGLGFLTSAPASSAADSSAGRFLGAQAWTGACCVAAVVLCAPAAWEIKRSRMLFENRRRRRRAVKV